MISKSLNRNMLTCSEYIKFIFRFSSQISPIFRFSRLDKEGKGFLSREDFLRIPELAINPLGDRIVHGFFYESKVSIAIFQVNLPKIQKKNFLKVINQHP